MAGTSWLETPADHAALDALRSQFQSDAARILVFLGAGLSFGVGRFLGRATFDQVVPWDDGRFPNWPTLIARMSETLEGRATDPAQKQAYKSFFEHNDAVDCAQLFRASLSAGEYRTFLEAQFGSRPDDADSLTASHHELVRLEMRELFTTNYDELIEVAFQSEGVALTVSDSPKAFLENQVQRPDHHLIKLHGTIARPDGIVLTRDDYATARRDRAEMFAHLAQELRFTTFLFLGFSLADPNFNLLRDEARVVMQGNMPESYLVQKRADPIVRDYLASLSVATIGISNWNNLPKLIASLRS